MATNDDSSDPLETAIVVGSTRPGRRGEVVARWVHEIAASRGDASYELVDLADYSLPHLDEPVPPRAAMYSQPHTHAWAETIDAYDAFVFVTPEYNHSTSGALKNAIDFLYAEWNHKAAGFVSYGADGGTRAVEHLRLVMGELKVAPVQPQCALSLFDDFKDYRSPDSAFTPREHQRQSVESMLDELTAWAGAMRSVRLTAAV